MTVEESLTIVNEMKLDVPDLSAKTTWSLSEILNPPDPRQQSINRFAKGIGFK